MIEDDSIADRLSAASYDIGNSSSYTLLELSPRLLAKYQLTGQQLSVAMLRAFMLLACGSAAGLGPGDKLDDTATALRIAASMQEIKPIIGAAIGGEDCIENCSA